MSINEDVEREGSREPLIIKKEDDDSSSATKGHPWMVYLSTFVAVCGSYAFGTCAGYSSPTQSAIRSDLDLTLAEYSVFGSILTFGAMIGAITSGPIADLVGRKWTLNAIHDIVGSVQTMRMSSGFCMVGWFAIYFAEGPLSLDIGRLATGYGMGCFSYVVPVFIAELAPKDLRGLLTAINQLMIVMGVSVSFIVGAVVSWRTLALIGLIPCGVLLFGLFFIPESPRWLAKVGRNNDFKVALQKLRANDSDVSAEAAEIQDYIETLQRLPKAKVLDLFQRRYLRSVIIGVGLMVFQQFGGINGICFYTSDIFEQAGFSSSVGTIIYAVVQVVVTAIAATLVDKSGRKPLLLVSASGLVLGCLLAAVSFYLKARDLASDAVPILTVAGILLYIASFSAGMGAVPWVVMSEIFPINIKGVAGGFATLVNWFGAWAVSYTFNFLMAWSSYGTFVLYAAINAIAIWFVIKVVPETKGKTLEQIQASINS